MAFRHGRKGRDKKQGSKKAGGKEPKRGTRGARRARSHEKKHQQSRAHSRPDSDRDHRKSGFSRERASFIGTGRVQKNSRGFAFVIIDESAHPDVFLPPNEAAKLMDGDRIELSAFQSRGRTEGKVEKVLQRAQTTVVGQIQKDRADILLRTFNNEFCHVKSDIPIQHGDWVMGDIERYPSDNEPALVKVTQSWGKKLIPKRDNELAIIQYHLRDEFSKKLFDELERKINNPNFWADATKGREDLRHKPFVTIDGEDAKDFDDAILIEAQGDGYVLWVAIADVSAFVEPDTEVDKEARARSTSTYFPGFVVPMLPERLSNDLCSLRPRQERLALVAKIEYDANASVKKSTFFEATIKTAHRLTYTQVNEFAKGNKQVIEEIKDVAPSLTLAGELFKKLWKKRELRGALDFELPECKIELNDNGFPIRLKEADRFISNRWIEEFMIAANSEVARFLSTNNVPALYREHQTPEEENRIEMNDWLKRLGFNLQLKKLDAKSLSDILKQTEGKKGSHTLHHMILRLQKQAKYQSKSEGHFGLALKYYTHFTSPIRRYPDLVVHRSLKSWIKRKNLDIHEVNAIAAHCSAQERVSMEAERWVVKRKQCWFFSERIGEALEGRIAGMISKGVFVEIPKYFAEAFLPFENMQGYYEWDEKSMVIRKRPGKESLGIGDTLKCSVGSVSMEENQITLTQRES